MPQQVYSENHRLVFVKEFNRMSYELYPAEKSGWDQLCTEHRITGQEKLAMQGILEGKTNTDIAENLNISKNTVTKYIA